MAAFTFHFSVPSNYPRAPCFKLFGKAFLGPFPIFMEWCYYVSPLPLMVPDESRLPPLVLLGVAKAFLIFRAFRYLLPTLHDPLLLYFLSFSVHPLHFLSLFPTNFFIHSVSLSCFHFFTFSTPVGLLLVPPFFFLIHLLQLLFHPFPQHYSHAISVLCTSLTICLIWMMDSSVISDSWGLIHSHLPFLLQIHNVEILSPWGNRATCPGSTPHLISDFWSFGEAPGPLRPRVQDKQW